MPFAETRTAFVYAAFSNHGGEGDVIKVGFSGRPWTRYEGGTREIFHHEPDVFAGYVNGFPAGRVEQAVHAFARRLGLLVPREFSPSGSTETIVFDRRARQALLGALPSGDRRVDRFVRRVVRHFGPALAGDGRMTIEPGTILRHQRVSRRYVGTRDGSPPVNWNLVDRLGDGEVRYRPPSRGARYATGLNPEDWRGLQMTDI